MKNWLITKTLVFAGQKLDGYGTKISGAFLILVGVAGFVGVMFPDQGLPQMTTEASLGFIGVGIAALRGRHAIGKVEQQVASLSETLVQQSMIPPNPQGSTDKTGQTEPGPPHGSGAFGPNVN